LWVYAGEAEPVEVADQTPVGVVWSFSPPPEGVTSDAIETGRPGYLEGIKRLKTHYVTERDPGLVRDFKANLKSWACQVCDFDFEATYGNVGRRYIEAHHINLLAEGGQVETTLDDLLAVCANCHRMLHRGRPGLSPDELREALKARL
jgi:5-methylcytosine-specific restriction protein A